MAAQADGSQYRRSARKAMPPDVQGCGVGKVADGKPAHSDQSEPCPRHREELPSSGRDRDEAAGTVPECPLEGNYRAESLCRAAVPVRSEQAALERY